MKVTKIAILFASISAVLISSCGNSKSSLINSCKIYRGELPPYSVEIEVTAEEGKSPAWTVRLEPLDNRKEHPIPFALTGYDRDGDGRFDEIVIVREKDNDYGSLTFTGEGKRSWKPLPYNDSVEPTDTEIASVQAQLYSAIVSCYKSQCFVNSLENFHFLQTE